MYLGKRIIYNKKTGIILNYALEERYDNGLDEKTIDMLRPKEIDFIDLEYGDKSLDNALEYHIDVKTKKIIIDKYIPHVETKEEKLSKELLKAQSTIVDLKYKEILNSKNLGGK